MKTRNEWIKEVKIEMVKRDLSRQDLADATEFSLSAVTKQLNGSWNFPRLVRMIELYLGIEPFTEEVVNVRSNSSSNNANRKRTRNAIKYR